jgi:hypothetical protein
MAKQLMIYERAVPISSERHRDWYVKTGTNFSFANEVNSVPILAAEFIAAATEFTIIFAGEGDAVFPAVILSMRNGENAYVDEDGAWLGKYTPAFLRRYPFVFSLSEDKETFTLCIDEDFEGCNTDGRGERLFDAEGARTQYLEAMLNFSRQYQAQFLRTTQFTKRLRELDLLEPAEARFQLPGGESAALAGFFTINRNKLKALPGETLAEMAKTDELELCYVHLQSLNNITPMAQKQVGATPIDTAKAEPADQKEPAEALSD